MHDDDALPPDPRDAEFFAKYVISCTRLGVTPVSVERAAELIRQCTDALKTERRAAREAGLAQEWTAVLSGRPEPTQH